MFKNNIFFKRFFKGFLIGFGAIIPGLSGGTVAVIVNIFEEIIESVANIRIHFKKSIIILTPVALGALTSIYLISAPIKLFCEYLPHISKYLFCFITAVSIFFFAKNSIEFSVKKSKILYFIFGIICSFMISVLTKNFQMSDLSQNVIIVFILGLPLSFALVLPGISFSYMMLFFDLYDKALYSIKEIALSFLLPLFSGIVLGAFVFSKLLLRLIEKNKQETYSFVLGFVINSLFEILS